MTALTELDRDLLAFEAIPWRNREQKDTCTRELFDCSPTVYAQRVNALIRRPEALAANPALVRRLLRLRAQHLPTLPPATDPTQHRRRLRTRQSRGAAHDGRRMLWGSALLHARRRPSV